MLLSRTLAGLASLASLALADDYDSPKDLGSVLASNKNLTTYYELIKVCCPPPVMSITRSLIACSQKYPDILLQLPSYVGVTVS